VFAQTRPRVTYECGAFGIEESNPWRGNVRSQGQTMSCWAFAAIAFVENAYRVLTCNNMYLSVEQVIDGVKKLGDECGRNPGYNGGLPLCALGYIEQFGIMTEYMYPFTNGGDRSDLYDVSKITSIGVKDIRLKCYTGSFQERITCAIDALYYSPIIAGICAADGLPIEDRDAYGNVIIVDNPTCINPDHGVLVTKIWEYVPGVYAIEYQNSHGIRGISRGIEVMLVRNDTTNEFGPRSVFSQMIIAQVYDKNADAEDSVSEIPFPFSFPSSLFDDEFGDDFAKTEQIAIAALVITVLTTVALISGIGALMINYYRNRSAQPPQV